MRVGTLVKIAVVAVAVFAVALIAVVKSLDINQYRGLIAEQVAKATGRDLAIRGDLNLALSLTPSLVVEDVALANIPGGSRPEMVTVKRLEAEVALLPLITGTVKIDRLVLVEPDVLLEVTEQGQENWVLAPAPEVPEGDISPPVGDDAPRTEVEIHEVRVENARFAYHDARNGSVTTAAFDYLDLSAPNAAAPIGIDGEGRINTQSFKITGSAASLQALNAGEAFPVKLTISDGGFLVSLDGTAGARAVDMQIAAEGNEAADLARLAGAELPGIGPFRFRGRLHGDESVMALADIDAALGKAELGKISVTGQIQNVFGVNGIDLALEVRADEPAALSALVGGSVPPAGPVRLTARLLDTAEGLRLADLSGEIGESDIAGEAALVLAGERPALTARLASERFRLADILGPAAEREKGAGAGREEAKAQAPADGRVIPDVALPVSALRLLDADVEWTVNDLMAGEVQAESARIALQLADGRLTLSPAARIANGSVGGETVLEAGATPAAGLRLEAEGVEIGGLLRALRLSDAMQGGASDIAVDLRGQGATLREILASTDGRVSVVMDQAVLANDYVDLLALDVMREVAPWASKEDVTRVQCMVARFEVEDGVADTRAFLFDTAHMTLGGEGTIDLGRERLDLTLVPRPKEASLMNLAMPMDVGGTFAKPTVLPNKAGAVKGIVGLAAGAALGPAGLLVPFVSAGDDGNPCVEALEDGGAAEAPASSGNPVEDGLKGAGEGLGDFFGGVFGKQKK